MEKWLEEAGVGSEAPIPMMPSYFRANEPQNPAIQNEVKILKEVRPYVRAWRRLPQIQNVFTANASAPSVDRRWIPKKTQ
jgi:hypothetical protein